MLYNARLRKGWLFEKLRNNKRVKNTGPNNVEIITGIEVPVEQTGDGIESADIIEGIEVAADVDSDKEIGELIKFFKKCVLPDNRSELIKKLRDSAEIRHHNIQNERTIFKSSRHLYVLSSELVNKYSVSFFHLKYTH